jgi:hypothetical protein
MAFYAVYLPPPRAGVAEADALAEAVVLRDGFSVMAFLFTGLWLLAKRLWLPFLAFAVAYGLIVLAQLRYGLHPAAAAAAQLVLGLWLGLEGTTLLGRKLVDRGWRFVDVVEARNQEEAERRFFERALAAPAMARPASPPPPPGAAPAASVPRVAPPAGSGVIGMFPEAGAR